MKKAEWSYWRTALVFSVIIGINTSYNLWRDYYPLYESIGLSDNQVTSIVGQIVGAMIAGAPVGYFIAGVRNRFFR